MTPFHVPVVRGVVSSPYGTRTHPVTNEAGTFHNGIDFAAPEGEPVLAAKEGVIEAVNENSETAGKIVVIRHADGTRTRYLHMSRILINKVGLKVFARQAIGQVGSTGRSTGNHLHFEVLDKNGKPMDPGPLLGLTVVEKGLEVRNLSYTAFPLVVLALVAVSFLFRRTSWAY